ncbi:MAG: amino acid ABC transporter ATP-binding/permease protein, partial [Solirubrobacterales bacterium]
GAELVTSGADARFASQIERSGERLRAIQKRDAFAGSASVALSSLIGGLTVVAVLALAVSGSADGALPGVAIAVLLFLAMGVFEAVNPLSTAAQSAEHSRAAAGRIGDVLNLESPIVPVAEPLPIPSGGALELSGVSFSYGDGEPMLLRDADFVLQPGERVALIGPSGSGKSTIANLLVRFLDPTAGSVTLGGTDVRLVDADAVRRAVRLESQTGFLFTTTIRENLLIGNPDADDAALTAILVRVGLGDWLASLPKGLETLVGEQGDNLSGGQRQRIAFARGLLAQSRFLILDEPTAQLDRENADALIDAIISDTPPATGVLVITHDDRSIGQFDRVLALKGGHLVSYP